MKRLNRHQVIPIIWDDMMRHMTADVIKNSGLGNLVEPMVWVSSICKRILVKYLNFIKLYSQVYAEDVYRFAGHYVFEGYSLVFPTFWAASAFKGAFGETMVVPDVSRHVDNNLNWLQVKNASLLLLHLRILFVESDVITVLRVNSISCNHPKKKKFVKIFYVVKDYKKHFFFNSFTVMFSLRKHNFFGTISVDQSCGRTFRI